jgi:RND superfamily putative drug exporter
VTAALFMLGAPALHLTLADSDARSLPAGSQERRVYETLEREFPSLTEEPITVLIEARSAEPAVRALLTDLATLANVKEIYQRSGLPHGVTVVDITADDHTSAQQAEQLVRTIRTIPADVPMLVAGPTAQLLDAKDSTARHLPAAISLIAVSTALLLFALTGSVVIPVKALLMNALTLTATLGILVAIFQWGWGDHLLGFQAWGALDLTTPLLLFVFIFGLSMDYEVFLLARVKEAWDRRERPAGDSGTRDPSDQAFTDRAASDRAVLEGISATGPVVTTAALSIGVVFLGFALGDLVAVKEIGVGMTVAVLLDVTVVRGLLLPAAMSLLGARNWWPGWRRGKAAARTVDQDAERPLAAT